jgi:hypothetical protein
MIKKILAASMLSLILANSVFANTKSINTDPRPLKVNSNTLIKKIAIYGNVDVMLVPGEGSDVSINGTKNGAEKIKLIYQHDRLEIVAPHFENENKTVVLIPAKDLVRLEINGNANIYSEATLLNGKLDIYLNGLCNINLRSHGKIKVHASPDYKLTFTKNEVAKIKKEL